MTLANIFVKTTRDRWLGWAIAAVSISLFLLFGMSVYREIDLSVYTSLPEAFRSLIGIGDDIDVGGLAINVMFGTWGALVVAAIALVMGAAAIAGEETGRWICCCRIRRVAPSLCSRRRGRW